MLATSVVVGFQVALAAGAPWGELTMGGRVRGQLPPVMRVAVLLVSSLVVALTTG